MRSGILTCLALSVGLGLAAAVTPVAAGIPYAAEQVIAEGDTPSVVAQKAAMVLPRPNQSDWMRLERTFFLHFGVNTFNQVEWGSGREDLAPDAGRWG